MHITAEESKVIDQLYYLSYQAQRQHYGLSAKQAATVFQSAAKYERIYLTIVLKSRKWNKILHLE